MSKDILLYIIIVVIEMNNKVVIIGCGNVGMSFAYSLLNQKTYVNELVLIDIDTKRLEGEVMDLNHCLAYSPSKINIKLGEYSDCKDAKIVVISAGANQNIGETRMDLINKNSKIFKKITYDVMNSGFNGIFLVATNPLDIMTYLTYKYSNLPCNRVLGTGTTLDTARLRYLVSEKLEISPKDIEAFVVGEHGDSEFIPWSNVSIALKGIDEYLTNDEKVEIEDEVRNSAYEIINKKGATYYGIGMCLTRITDAILGDENVILSVSAYDKENDIYISTPAIVNKDGVKEKIFIPLTSSETEKIKYSINCIKKAIDSLQI